MAINSLFRGRIKRIHLVGIGGIGMSGIARVLIDSGFIVSGSDISKSQETSNLRSLGARIFIGHHENNVLDADVVVFSSAVPPDNVELRCAKLSNIPIIKRALMLAELMSLRCGIAVAGAHGKTTTTSLIGTLMHSHGLDPTIIIGGIINHFESNAVMGQGQFMVTEADESDGTFLHLKPSIAVVTNIDREHLDYFQGGLEEICEKFISFLNNLPFYGLAVVCSDDENIKVILPKLNRRVISYGLNPEAEYRACNIETKGFSTSFDLMKHGTFIERFTIRMVGLHNVLNALAAIAVLEELGTSASLQKDALFNFNGVKRRFSPLCLTDGITVIDDYAHHPTEISAVLKAAKSSFSDAKIRVLFQPHRYSRTKDLLHEFSQCFNDCDSLIITDIYSAQEQPIAGIDAHALIRHIEAQNNFKVEYARDLTEGAVKIAEISEKNDIVLTLGAGSITTIGPTIVSLLKEKHGNC
jgi:UDP-N-acetylmuramate--alanine ligase